MKKVAEAAVDRPAKPPDAQAQALLDALTAHIAVLDAMGRIVAVNEAWRRFGLDNAAPPDVIAGVGLDYLAACRGSAAESAADGIRAVMAGSKDDFTLEYPCHSPSRQRWFLFSVRPLVVDDGVSGVVVAHIDITERVAADHERQYRYEQLTSAARLSSLATLCSSVIHEIAQPLAAARLYGEALQVFGNEEPLDLSRLLRVVGSLHGQVERAVAIVEGLRKFTRSGEAETEASLLQTRIGDAVSLCGGLLRHQEVDLDVRLSETPIWVCVNPLQIEQVLVNLLCNGVEAMERANSPVRRLSIELAVVDELARVSIIDTGPGFASGLPNFEFFGGASSGAGEQTGMGMGLAISRAIVEAHGGELWAESLAVGATLRFTLPLLEAPM